MSSLYNIELLDEGAAYQFTTFSGDVYIAYFTEFTLLDPDEHEVPVISFGFTCRSVDNKTKHYDSKIKYTIIHIIEVFFDKQPDEAVLYMCMNNDGKARNRQITFGNWYHEFGGDLEKHSSSSEHGKKGFYASILFKSSNQKKKSLISAFHFTINYWGLNDI